MQILDGGRTDPDDFRTFAVVASDKRLSRTSGADVRTSSCMPTDSEGAAFWRRLIMFRAIALTVGTVGIFAAGIPAFAAKFGLIPKTTSLVLYILPLFSIGFVAILLAETYDRRMIRRHIARQIVGLWDGSHPVVLTWVQDAAAYAPRRLVGDDVGYLIVYPETESVVIEGVLYRYVICSEDVFHLDLHPDQQSIELGFRIDGAELTLNLVPKSSPREFRRQAKGRGGSWMELLHLTLSGVDRELGK